MYDKNYRIETINDVQDFAKYLYNNLRVAFHPDDDFADYVNDETGKQTFTKEEIPIFNRLMDECFQVCECENKDIYEVMSEFHPLLNLVES
jgi:hypothetical protein